MYNKYPLCEDVKPSAYLYSFGEFKMDYFDINDLTLIMTLATGS